MIELLQLDLTFQLLELMLMPRLHIRQLLQMELEIYNSGLNMVIPVMKDFVLNLMVESELTLFHQ